MITIDTKQLPKGWQSVRLGEYVKKVGSGITPRGGEAVYLQSGIPLIRSQNVHLNRFEMKGLAFISPEQDKQMKETRVLSGDVLLNITGASIGRVCVVPSELCPANVNQHVCIIRTDKTIEPSYLALYISNPDFQMFIANTESGATRQALTKAQIEDFQVPVPPLEEQKRIVAIAQKADRLRRTRRYALQLSDTYLRSVFLEMFGNPVTNPEGWDILPLNKLCTNITDGTHDTPDRLPSGVPFITSKNIRPYQMDLTDLEFVSLETHQEIIKRCNPSFGDILYTNIGVNVGNAVANRLKFSFSLKNVALLQPNHKILNHLFLESLLNNEIFKRHIIQISSIGGAQKFISLEVLRNISVIKPPLPLQEKFAQIVQKFDRLRTQQREADRQAEHLFQTLLHRAFRGELTSQNADDEPESLLLEEIRAQQAKAKAEAKTATQAMGDAAEYIGTKAKQQDIEPIQLKFPGFE
ncbi:restriction endonuclease subunit S [Microcoleus vaginatus GB1-A2]|uniref:restriction endonuclease subunit S n=1 Tax=Microcoleus vaginatus TaxID=119532 RepID=UPI001688AECA|nr:restriction endonuclease subunit S [Microcoleus sp. FACHB-61]